MKTHRQVLLIAAVAILLAHFSSPAAYAQWGFGGGGGGGGSKWGGGGGGGNKWGGGGNGGSNWGQKAGGNSGNNNSGNNWGKKPGSNSGGNAGNDQSGNFLDKVVRDAQERLKQKAAENLQGAAHGHHHDDYYDDGDRGGYQQPAPIPVPKPVVPPANKLPQISLVGSLPRCDERFGSVEGKAPLALPGGVRIVNPLETGRIVAFSFEQRDYRLAAGQGALLPIEDNALVAFQPNPEAVDPTRYALASGQTYSFSYTGGKWVLNRSLVRFQVTIDNSQNPFPFFYLTNASEQVVEPYKSRVLAHAAPMCLAFDTGDGQAQKKIYQSNTSNFKLGNRVKVQGEDRIEVVHETVHKVVLSDQNRWVLVDKSNWQQVKTPAAREPERIADSSRPRDEATQRPSTGGEASAKLPADETEIPPKLYVLSIGVSKYKDARYNLSYAHRDADAFAEVWKKQAGLMYRDVETRVLTDDQATKRNIESSLGWLEKQVTRRDNAVIMVSGHGMLDPKNRFYIATHDMDDKNLKATCVPRSSLEDTLSSLSGAKALVFLDTCHSGQNFGAGGGIRKGGFGLDVLKNLPDAGEGVVVFTSSQANEVSLEKELWGHGAFTKAFLDAMNDPHVTDLNADGYLAINELDFALQERVKNLTDGQQHPSYDKSQSIKTGGCIMRFRKS